MSKPDVVLLMSWMNPTWWIAAVACRLFKVPFMYLTDANVRTEQAKAKWKVLGKKILLDKILFPQTAGALCAGTANKRLYSHYGIPDERLFPFVYSWGMRSFYRFLVNYWPRANDSERSCKSHKTKFSYSFAAAYVWKKAF